ncbi:MAG: hypothetical protein CMJ70_25590 [Planctomycetaceae bacterium]|nr:hypothetical protein [Planctomycetaceae bacterium]|tara:strand:+ start:481 stop:780 length:300 start_codon:yes stop_codon:yes gene_type:complete
MDGEAGINQRTPRFTASFPGGFGDDDRRFAARAFVGERDGSGVGLDRQSRFREVDNPVLSVRRRFASGFVESETEDSCRRCRSGCWPQEVRASLYIGGV